MWLNFALSLTAVTLFSLCARAFIQTLRRPIPVFNTTGYSRLALKMRKLYMTTAWGIMTLTFLATMLVSWHHLWEETSAEGTNVAMAPAAASDH